MPAAGGGGAADSPDADSARTKELDLLPRPDADADDVRLPKP